MRRYTAVTLSVLGGFALGLVLPVFRSPEIKTPPLPKVDLPFSEVDAVASAAPSEDRGERVVQILKRPPSLARDVALAEALSQMSAEDFAKRFGELRDLLKEKSSEEKVVAAVLDAWFAVAPTAAREAASKEIADPNNRGYWSLGRPLGAAAARHDPQWAVDNLLIDTNESAPGWTSNAAIMEEVTKKDRKLAEATMAKYQDSGWRQTLLAGYVDGLGEIDPLAAFDVAISEKSFQRVNLIPSAIEAVARRGEGLAREALSKIEDGPERWKASWLAAGVIATESVADPFAFLQETAGLDQARNTGDLSVTQTLSYLVQRDPTATINWAMSLPEERRETILGTVLDLWGRSDPNAMIVWAQTQQAAVAGETGTNPKSAAAFPATQFAADFAKVMAAKSLLNQGQVQAALQAAPSQMSNLTSAMQDFFWEAAMRDPAATASWAVHLPTGEIQDAALQTAAWKYATANPTGAAEWIEQVPAGSARDSAIQGLVESFVGEDPVAASEWVSQVSDPMKREKLAMEVWGAWARNNESAARTWFNSLPWINERTKKKTLEQ